MAIYSGVTLPEQRPAPGFGGAGFGAGAGKTGRRGQRGSLASLAAPATSGGGGEAEAEAGPSAHHYAGDPWLALRHRDCDAPYAGGRVVVRGVRGRPDLSGQVGDAVSFDEVCPPPFHARAPRAVAYPAARAAGVRAWAPGKLGP